MFTAVFNVKILNTWNTFTQESFFFRLCLCGSISVQYSSQIFILLQSSHFMVITVNISALKSLLPFIISNSRPPDVCRLCMFYICRASICPSRHTFSLQRKTRNQVPAVSWVTICQLKCINYQHERSLGVDPRDFSQWLEHFQVLLHFCQRPLLLQSSWGTHKLNKKSCIRPCAGADEAFWSRDASWGWCSSPTVWRKQLKGVTFWTECIQLHALSW